MLKGVRDGNIQSFVYVKRTDINGIHGTNMKSEAKK